MLKPAALVVSLLLAAVSTAYAADSGKRQQLADSSRARLTDVTRALTSITWSDRVDQFLGEIPSAKTLGTRWNSKEPHWIAARNAILGQMMRAFHDLEDSPEPKQRMDLPFTSLLTEAEAAEVLALAPPERKELDDFADSITLALDMLKRDPMIKPGTPAFHEDLAPVQTLLGIDAARARQAPKAKIAEKTSHDYEHARQSAVDFLRAALDGQLQLYFNDNLEALQRIGEAAAKECANKR